MYFGRSKNKIQNPYTLKDSYESYIATVDVDSPYYVSYEIYSMLIENYIQKVMAEIIGKASIFKMPYRLGELQIIKLRSSKNRFKKYSIDFNLTNKYQKTIYHLNEHSSGYKYMFRWGKINSIVKNKSKYRFIPTRTNKRTLAYNIKHAIVDYFES